MRAVALPHGRGAIRTLASRARQQAIRNHEGGGAPSHGRGETRVLASRARQQAVTNREGGDAASRSRLVTCACEPLSERRQSPRAGKGDRGLVRQRRLERIGRSSGGSQEWRQ